MTKILITGGAGFIGERLASRLAADRAEVHVVDNLSRGKMDDALRTLFSTGTVRFVDVDLLVPEVLESLPDDYTAIVHLAAIVGVENVLRRPYRTLRDNVLMHEAVLHLAGRQKHLQRFLFASTSEVYAGSLIHMDMPVPTPEDFPLALTSLDEPRTSYMLSKIVGEAMVRYSGLPFTIVRPHNVYGPRMGMAHVVPQLLEKAHKAAAGSAIEVFSLEHKRCFCYIDDAVAMLTAVLKSPAATGQVLNLGAQGPELTIRELVDIIIATVGKPLKIAGRPPSPGSPTRRAPDMTRMTRITGITAAIGLAEGVRRTYDWYRRHVFDPVPLAKVE